MAADANTYRSTPAGWTSTSNCNCGGRKANVTVQANAAYLLIWQEALAGNVTSNQGITYALRPHQVLLDMDPVDFAQYSNDPRFRIPRVGDLPQAFGYRGRNTY